MMDVYKAHKCCNKFMKLVSSYFVENEDSLSYFIFQCSKCGRVADCSQDDLKYDAKRSNDDE